MNDYDWDIAISLCKEDASYAKELSQALNPLLKVFFYEDNQEELVGQDAIRKFAAIFKSDSRIVVILARKEYGKTGYTKLEQNAIHDRALKDGMDFSFLIMVQMEADGCPDWYPATRIYTNSKTQTIKEIAAIIEYKLTEKGGAMPQLTFEDRMKRHVAKAENKRANTYYLQSSESLDEAIAELKKFEDLVNEKIELAMSADLNITKGRRKFNAGSSETKQSSAAFLHLGEHRLEFATEYYQIWNGSGSQTFTIHISVGYNSAKQINEMQRYFDGFTFEGKIQKDYKFNKFETKIGWSERVIIEVDEFDEIKRPYFNLETKYELDEISSTSDLVDYWFTELFKNIENGY